MGRATARNLAFRQRLGGSARGRIFLADSAWRSAISTGGKALGEKYLNRRANWPGSAHLSI
jgi:hypothetical protein